MSTRLTVPIAAENGASHRYLVTESFDEVLSKIAPTNGQPSSVLEHREACTYHTADGARLWLPPQAIAVIEEGVEDDA